MNKWLKYNLSQNTYSPTSVQNVINNKRDVIHSELINKAKRKMILNELDENGLPIFMEHVTSFDDSLSKEDCIFAIDVRTTFEKEHNDSFPIRLMEIEFEFIENDSDFYVCNLNDWKFIEKNLTTDTYLDIPKMICIRRNLSKSFGDNSFIKYVIDLTPYWNKDYNEFTEKIDENIITTNLIDDYKFNDIIEYDYVNEKATLENRVEQKKRKIKFAHIQKTDTLNIKYKGI